MDLTDQQLTIILQACIDFSKQLLAREGGFVPFGTRAKPDGEIEFVQLARESEEESLDDLYRRTASLLTEEARRNEILASALVANTSIEESQEDDFQMAITVLIEAPNFCRSITAPYRIENASDGTGEFLDFGKLVPQPAEHVVFGTEA